MNKKDLRIKVQGTRSLQPCAFYLNPLYFVITASWPNFGFERFFYFTIAEIL